MFLACAYLLQARLTAALNARKDVQQADDIRWKFSLPFRMEM